MSVRGVNAPARLPTRAQRFCNPELLVVNTKKLIHIFLYSVQRYSLNSLAISPPEKNLKEAIPHFNDDSFHAIFLTISFLRFIMIHN